LQHCQLKAVANAPLLIDVIVPLNFGHKVLIEYNPESGWNFMYTQASDLHPNVHIHIDIFTHMTKKQLCR
jgi:hypothetical protein